MSRTKKQTIATKNLELRCVKPELHKEARQRFRDNNAKHLLWLVGGHERVYLVRDNVEALKERNMYEIALLEALLGTSQTNAHIHPWILVRLLSEADQKRMRALGQPLPQSQDGWYQLYRGVAGPERDVILNGFPTPARRIREGISWTNSLVVATHFATAYDFLEDPAVYEAKIHRDAVYCFTNERSEQEFIVLPHVGDGITDVRRVQFAPDSQVSAWREGFRKKREEFISACQLQGQSPQKEQSGNV